MTDVSLSSCRTPIRLGQRVSSTVGAFLFVDELGCLIVRSRCFDSILNPLLDFIRDPANGTRAEIYGPRKFVQIHLVVNRRAGEAGMGNYFRQTPNRLANHVASSWVLLNMVRYSNYTDTQFQQIDIAECLRQDSTYWVMFPVAISRNVDKMSVATIVVARQESPNNWVFLVVELFLLVYHLDRAFST